MLVLRESRILTEWVLVCLFLKSAWNRKRFSACLVGRQAGRHACGNSSERMFGKCVDRLYVCANL